MLYIHSVAVGGGILLPTTSLTLLSKWNDSFWWMKVKIALELLCTPSRNSFAQNADEAFSSVCLHKLRYANLMTEFAEHIAVKYDKKCNFGPWVRWWKDFNNVYCLPLTFGVIVRLLVTDEIHLAKIHPAVFHPPFFTQSWCGFLPGIPMIRGISGFFI